MPNKLDLGASRCLMNTPIKHQGSDTITENGVRTDNWGHCILKLCKRVTNLHEEDTNKRFTPFWFPHRQNEQSYREPSRRSPAENCAGNWRLTMAMIGYDEEIESRYQSNKVQVRRSGWTRMEAFPKESAPKKLAGNPHESRGRENFLSLEG